MQSEEYVCTENVNSCNYRIEYNAKFENGNWQGKLKR